MDSYGFFTTSLLLFDTNPIESAGILGKVPVARVALPARFGDSKERQIQGLSVAERVRLGQQELRIGGLPSSCLQDIQSVAGCS